jgi:hypothetical protein
MRGRGRQSVLMIPQRDTTHAEQHDLETDAHTFTSFCPNGQQSPPPSLRAFLTRCPSSLKHTFPATWKRIEKSRQEDTNQLEITGRVLKPSRIDTHKSTNVPIKETRACDHRLNRLDKPCRWGCASLQNCTQSTAISPRKGGELNRPYRTKKDTERKLDMPTRKEKLRYLVVELVKVVATAGPLETIMPQPCTNSAVDDAGKKDCRVAPKRDADQRR